MNKKKFHFDVTLKDWALPLNIDFDSAICGPWFEIHILCFKMYWCEEEEK